MTYELAIGDRAYSSWSLRGWLLFEAFGLPAKIRLARLYSEQLPELLADFSPARTVPAVRTPDGHVVWDTFAMAEHLAEAHPDAGLWPGDPAMRTLARSLTAEMHSSFGALRSACPMNLRVSYSDFRPEADVAADVERITHLWHHALGQSGGPWLCGDYSVADVFFAPVAARIAGYNLPVDQYSLAYVEAHLDHAGFRRWRAMALVDGPDQEAYYRPYKLRQWPHAVSIDAEAVAEGPSLNAVCPYSDKPVTHFLKTGGKVFGFCNAFCRDKTLADPEAWPQFMAIYHS